MLIKIEVKTPKRKQSSDDVCSALDNNFDIKRSIQIENVAGICK